MKEMKEMKEMRNEKESEQLTIARILWVYRG
jgi:hypothetical protein